MRKSLTIAALLLTAAAPVLAAETRDNGEVSQVVYQVNVNEATAEQLQLLYRTGPAISARIIAEREADGPFVDLPDLVARVEGIGVRWAACNADFVSYSGETDLQTKIDCGTD